MIVLPSMLGGAALHRASGMLCAPARSQRGRDLHHRPVYLSTKLKAPSQSQGQQGPPHREGELDLALSLPRRPAAGVAGGAAVGGLGLQFGSDDAHAGNAHLLVTAEDRKGRRRPSYLSRYINGTLAGPYSSGHRADVR
jgi:hypothetical protein